MEQQAWILRSFLEQLERQEAVDDQATNGIAGEFARLKSQSTRYRTDKTFPAKTAEKQENIKRNRYKDIVPFDHSRVKLSLTTAKTDTDYINASFIKGVSGSRAYIATQGPLPCTVLDFLRMLWEYNIKVVVMACREFEMGKKKCEVYWPQQQTKPFVCEPFKVYCDSEENKGDYLSRTLRVTYRNGVRTLKQLHYMNWPDHGVPDSIPPILEMLQEMRSYQDHDDIPICIHCSAGCGRTGALCVIDYTWNLLRKQMITPDFSIYDLVQDMRTQRPSVVQTKEQYELVYRTIRLLFLRYLQSMEAQTCGNEVTVDQAAISPASTESELSYLNEELDLMPHLQHLLDEERVAPSQYHIPLPSAAAEPLIALKAWEVQWDQQQWDALRTPPDALLTASDQNTGRDTPPNLVLSSQEAPAAQERIQDDTVLQNPPPAMAEAICHMVEDPYFDSPVHSPSSEEAPIDPPEDTEQWTLSPIFSSPSLCLNGQTLEANSTVSGCNEVPPPLPERTPESYELAEDEELTNTCDMLAVIIQPNAAAEAVMELGGGPPSPVPPLPVRTPESFELAIDQAPVEVSPAVNLSVIGMSSECNSKPAAAPQSEAKPFMRSKSLKVKTTFSAPVTVNPSLNRMSNFYPYCPLDPPMPSQLPQTDGHVTPPIPDRTPESFVLPTEQPHEKNTLGPQPSETTQPSLRVGVSSEWAGATQPKKFLDVVMSRSKSVKAKSSKQEPLTAFHPLTPPSVVGAEGGSEQTVPSVNAERNKGTKDKSNEKGMSRTKSLKFFNKRKQKPKTPPPPPPSQPGAPPLSRSAPSVFKFGFGNRFGKPKGPRAHPETWF
ncbi:tyrosine-protein phosphatase non-receptor type 22 isoform X2 [Parambassis ranga]|uniref:protein-tyrosine-phosphatase n=1 Tax=Parambassis ranga TaxID=210632 RepID=A0A6P7IVR0_9TELE|nr:tyrosine-protein phosphatase non-receptor type 22-like isoform X2 [Parambassis ranga]